MMTQDLLEQKCEILQPSATAEMINSFEKSSGIIIPKDMKDFYLLTNGCDFNRDKNNVYINGEVAEQIQWIDRLDEVLLVNKDITEGLTDMDRVLDRFENCWSIGVGAFGNRIYIDYSEANNGEIYLSQKDEEYAIENDKWFIPMIRVANSLSEFIENLK